MTIVGVVGNVKDGPAEATSGETYYSSFWQSPSFQAYTAVRVSGDPLAIIPGAREITRQMGNDLSIQEIRPMERVMAGAVGSQRLALQIVALFALAAVMLAVIGIYGVVAFSVGQRRRELAIRSAVGARPSQTLWLIFGQGAKHIGAGLVLGLLAALAFSKVIAGMLYEVSPTDPLTFSLVAITLGGVAILACLIPARAALRIDPMQVLRHE
jgi:ABC-type antimicrobial peptide transport system permease subunit